MRIERPQHAVDRGVDQVAEVHFARVLRSRRLQELGVELQVVARVLSQGEQPIAGQPADQGREKEQESRSETPRSTHGAILTCEKQAQFGVPTLHRLDTTGSAGQ